MNWRTTPQLLGLLARNLARGQANFLRGIVKYNKVFSLDTMLGDHARPVHYELPLPPRPQADAPAAKKASQLYIHAPRGRAGRTIDDAAERFVEATRMGASG